MTKREALEKSIEMWQYIKDNKCTHKVEYFIDNNLEFVECNCYLCEYAVKKELCTNCPVKNWSIKGYTKRCCEAGSVYRKIMYTDAYVVADNMLFVLRRALNELNT